MLLLLPAVLYAYNRVDSLREVNLELSKQLSLLENRAHQYRWNRLEETGILSGTTVQAVKVLQDGRLALATSDNGLLIYDGYNYIKVNNEIGTLPDNFVTSVETIGTEIVAVGTASGLIFLNLSDLEPADVPYPDIPEHLPVTCLKYMDNGNLAAGTMGNGIMIFSRDGSVYSSGFLKENDQNSGLITSVLELTEKGRLIVSTAGAGIISIDLTRHKMTPELNLPGANEFYGLAKTDKTLWAGGPQTRDCGKKTVSGWSKFEATELEQLNIAGVFALSDQTLLVGTDDGSFLIDPEKGTLSRLSIPEELTPYPVVAAVEKESRLWLGLSGHGALIYDRKVVTGFSGGAKEPGDLIYDIEINPSDSSVWFAGWDGISIYDRHRWRKLGRAHGPASRHSYRYIFPRRRHPLDRHFRRRGKTCPRRQTSSRP